METVKPAGSMSLKPTPLRDVPALGFDRLKVRVVLAFIERVVAPNALAIVGAETVGGGGLAEEPPPQAAKP